MRRVDASRARRLWNVLTTTPTQRAQVDRAARHLDVTRSTWYRDVDLGWLDMNSSRRCVLGQLYGDYRSGLRALYGPFDVPFPQRLDARRAFRGSFPRRLWVVEVRRRRAAEAARTDAWCDLPSLAPDLPDVARRELLDANDRGETFAELADRIRRLP